MIDEWNYVEEVTLKFFNKKPQKYDEDEIASITLDEVLHDLEQTDMDDYIAASNISPESENSSRFPSCVCGQTPDLPSNLQEAKKLVLATAKMPFDNTNQMHIRVLQTIYRKLMGSGCERYGMHWEEIGFQSKDPATDLRGVGFLGLVQALYLVATPETQFFAKNVHRLSLDKVQEFPMMVLSLNVTRISMLALRDGLLDSLCSVEDAVWEPVNVFYGAVLLHIYNDWKDNNRTILHSSKVLAKAEQTCRNNVKKVVRTFRKMDRDNEFFMFSIRD